MESGQLPKIAPQGAEANVRKAIDAGERGAILVHRDVLLLRGSLFCSFRTSSTFVWKLEQDLFFWKLEQELLELQDGTYQACTSRRRWEG